MPSTTAIPSLASAAPAVQHRFVSRLFEGLTDWWQPPATVAVAIALVAGVIWLSRRDSTELARPLAILLAILRLATVAAVAIALLDLERIAEHELVIPSRVAVLVDSSASMSLFDQDGTEPATKPPADRCRRAVEVLGEGGLLAAFAAKHEVALWRFDAGAEPLALFASTAEPPVGWDSAISPRGSETRLGEAVMRVLDREPAAALAGIVLLSDGGNNAGVDPGAAAAALARAGVAVHVVGIGSERLPANVRVADLIAPTRVFPGDGFAVTTHLQAQGLTGERVEVELREQPTDVAPPQDGNLTGRLLDTRTAVLAADGELTAIRFDLPGLSALGSHTITVRVRPPPSDRSPEDDTQSAGIEVVDRVTQVLLMAGGPGREYQFMRNVLDRDPSFVVDVLLGTAADGISQDARRILASFPASDEELAAYDAVVAIDADWLAMGPAGWSRLERWVAQSSGGLLLAAGGIHMESWLSDPRSAPLRGLFPVELRRPEQVGLGSLTGEKVPLRLAFTPDGLDAEFLWLAETRGASAAIWSEFPGVYACYPADEVKPGATVYASVDRAGGAAGDSGPIFLAGQYYGAGSVCYAGSSELWRLRGIDDAAYERLVTQILRHVSHGRLTHGAKRARLLVDRDRHPVGGTVQVRLVLADEAIAVPVTGRPPICRVVDPDGQSLPLPLAGEPDRPGTLQGGFIVGREGTWRIELEPLPGTGDRLVRRIQVQLPDRELARPKLDRPLLEQLASQTGGTTRFPEPDGWTTDDAGALASLLPDRSRREYQTGVADAEFKQRLNATLLTIGCCCLCLEWIVRRLVKLA
jgi:hypothetical protein